MSYTAQHLHPAQQYTRPAIFEQTPKTGIAAQPIDAHTIQAFHQTLPNYAPTALHSLPSVASELGVAHVFLKDESTRFGLPAFKILGASWAIHRALCEKWSLDPTSTPYQDIGKRVAASNGGADEMELVTCTEGNWGRACARYASWIGANITIYVPGFMSEYTRRLVEGEGAKVKILEDSSYEDAIAAALKHSKSFRSMLVLDTSFTDYEIIPQWVTDGYTTMLTETNDQVAGQAAGARANTFFVSVGVGSWAQAVVSHYRASGARDSQLPVKIISVEPEAAACLKESLHCGELTSVRTGETIMAGMCCGTPSEIAWPILRDGLDAAVAVSDVEAHRQVEFLKKLSVSSGPCGAATLAAARRYFEGVTSLTEQQRKEMAVVLFSTEGGREYRFPEGV